MTTTIDRLSRAKKAESDYLKAILLHLTDSTEETRQALEEQTISYSNFAAITTEQARMVFIALEENDLLIWEMFGEPINNSALYGEHTEELKLIFFCCGREKRSCFITQKH